MPDTKKATELESLEIINNNTAIINGNPVNVLGCVLVVEHEPGARGVAFNIQGQYLQLVHRAIVLEIRAMLEEVRLDSETAALIDALEESAAAARSDAH